MKTAALSILAVLLFSTNAHAEKVRVYTDYSPVRILRVIGNADFDLEADKAGLKGTFKEVEDTAIPEDRSDRDFWKFQAGAIKVDKAKKKEAEDKKAKHESDRATALVKLKAVGLSEDELSALKIGS